MKFILYVGTGFVGCKHEDEIEIDDDEYNDMTESERTAYLDSVAQEFMNDRIEYGWKEVK